MKLSIIVPDKHVPEAVPAVPGPIKDAKSLLGDQRWIERVTATAWNRLPVCTVSGDIVSGLWRHLTAEGVNSPRIKLEPVKTGLVG